MRLDAYSNFTIYGGMRDTAQPSFELAGCRGQFSYYLTGLYRHSNLGFSSATRGPTPIHDDTNQGQGFAYLTYTPSADEAEPDLGDDYRGHGLPEPAGPPAALPTCGRQSGGLSIKRYRFEPRSAGLLQRAGVERRGRKPPGLPARVLDPLQYPDLPSRSARRSHLPGRRVTRVQQRPLEHGAGRHQLPPRRAYARRRTVYGRVWRRVRRQLARFQS